MKVSEAYSVPSRLNGRWADGWMDWQCYQSERRRNLLVKPFLRLPYLIAPKATNAMPMLWAGLEAIVGRDADKRDMHLDHDRRLLWGEQERE